jgi:membrane protein YdbS with pleckstrin-like domain
MSQLDQVMNPDEKLLFRTRLHWLPCAPGAIWVALLALVSIILVLVFGRTALGDLGTRYPIGTVAFAVVLVLAVVVPLIVIRFLVATHEFGVTDRRVIARMGWLSTRTVDLNVAKVESLVIEQGALGRLFGYGDLKVVGTGGTAETFHGVRDPIGFRKAVNSAADRSGALARQT